MCSAMEDILLSVNEFAIPQLPDLVECIILGLAVCVYMP